MKFTLKIDCDNAAFEDNPAREVANILRELGSKLDEGLDTPDDQPLLDSNGNKVGACAFSQ